MTSETRTIDLAALATELEAAGWNRDGGPVIELMRWDIDGEWFREISFADEDLPDDPADPFALHMCVTDGEDFKRIYLQDPVWQTALRIVHRHITATEGARR